MPDPRNVAHDKTVNHDKDDKHQPIVPDAAQTPQPGKKPPLQHHAKDAKVTPADGDAGPR